MNETEFAQIYAPLLGNIADALKALTDRLDTITGNVDRKRAGGALADSPPMKKATIQKTPRDVNAPKRPTTSYIRWCRDNRPRIVANLGIEGPDSTHAARGALTSEWNALTQEDKVDYEEQYKTAYEEYVIAKAEYFAKKEDSEKAVVADNVNVAESTQSPKTAETMESSSDSDSGEDESSSEEDDDEEEMIVKAPVPAPAPKAVVAKPAAKPVVTSPSGNLKASLGATATPVAEQPKKKKKKSISSTNPIVQKEVVVPVVAKTVGTPPASVVKAAAPVVAGEEKKKKKKKKVVAAVVAAV